MKLVEISSATAAYQFEGTVHNGVPLHILNKKKLLDSKTNAIFTGADTIEITTRINASLKNKSFITPTQAFLYTLHADPKSLKNDTDFYDLIKTIRLTEFIIHVGDMIEILKDMYDEKDKEDEDEYVTAIDGDTTFNDVIDCGAPLSYTITFEQVGGGDHDAEIVAQEIARITWGKSFKEFEDKFEVKRL